LWYASTGSRNSWRTPDTTRMFSFLCGKYPCGSNAAKPLTIIYVFQP
jgi:hypothetical protein